jgi:hypothetical protein
MSIVDSYVYGEVYNKNISYGGAEMITRGGMPLPTNKEDDILGGKVVPIGLNLKNHNRTATTTTTTYYKHGNQSYVDDEDDDDADLEDTDDKKKDGRGVISDDLFDKLFDNVSTKRSQKTRTTPSKHKRILVKSTRRKQHKAVSLK